MSGTSLDGVDGVVLEVRGNSLARLEWEVVAAGTRAYSTDQREAIRDALTAGYAASLNRLHANLGEWLATAAQDLVSEAGIDMASVDLVASHGQTIWHEPPDSGARGPGGGRGATLQLGDPATLAERLGRDVVADFRSRDVAAGGHGAPLVPWADAVLFSSSQEPLALQNLGGMANVTVLPVRTPFGPDIDGVIAFDTGPGMALVDGAMLRATNGAEPCDRDGVRVSRGHPDEGLAEGILSHPFFRKAPPRTTGREEFGDVLLDEIVGRVNPTSESQWDDLLATLALVTARSIGRAYDAWVWQTRVDRMVLMGGGARNRGLVELIRQEAGHHRVEVADGSSMGVDPEYREALCFALLGWAHVQRIPANVPGVTGAEGPRILGSLTPGGAG
jgi:anhydro-N-acetylmuramic acid kinase